MRGERDVTATARQREREREGRLSHGPDRLRPFALAGKTFLAMSPSHSAGLNDEPLDHNHSLILTIPQHLCGAFLVSLTRSFTDLLLLLSLSVSLATRCEDRGAPRALTCSPRMSDFTLLGNFPSGERTDSVDSVYSCLEFGLKFSRLTTCGLFTSFYPPCWQGRS